jgi:ABC-type Zn uptake system ZnuABC Zn-binding protein ZnuA
MSGRATEQTLSMLHELTAQALIEKIKSGEATSADLNAAIKFLKDNDISCVVTQSDPMKELIDELVDYDETVFMNSDDEVVLRAH